ncbi:hypothetical protein TNCV_295421 [Trichonephila clavipes]|nr:hypothetical protein TNCV_295421 [Trichonephila clavipes]
MNTGFPTPDAAIHHHETITGPPPCFTVGIVCFGWCEVFGLRDTIRRPSLPKMLNLLSSLKMTSSPKLPRLFVSCSFSEFQPAWLYSSPPIKGFFRATLPLQPAFLGTLRTVSAESDLTRDKNEVLACNSFRAPNFRSTLHLMGNFSRLGYGVHNFLSPSSFAILPAYQSS